MEDARKLKVNLKIQDKLCGWCHEALQLGDDAALCSTCGKEHHARCWDGKAGCSSVGCANAPLRRLDDPAVASSLPQAAIPRAFGLGSGTMPCPRCGVAIAAGSPICPACKAITSPDGLYHGVKTNAPGAVQSLVLGLIGLVFCQIILGPYAIAKASSARQAMAKDPTLGGAGLATAGTVLGIVDLLLFLIVVAIRLSKV